MLVYERADPIQRSSPLRQDAREQVPDVDHLVPFLEREVVEAVVRLARTEGIFAALESAHALAWIIRAAGSGELPAGANVLMTLSGRGDKDVSALMEAR